jgi:hypothetical protein
MATVRGHIKKFKAAHRLASDILASAHTGLPDENHIHHLATSIFVHGIKATDGEARTADHAGVNAKGDSLLNDVYDVDGDRP